jgi:hypothetical protein
MVTEDFLGEKGLAGAGEQGEGEAEFFHGSRQI